MGKVIRGGKLIVHSKIDEEIESLKEFIGEFIGYATHDADAFEYVTAKSAWVNPLFGSISEAGEPGLVFGYEATVKSVPFSFSNFSGAFWGFPGEWDDDFDNYGKVPGEKKPEELKCECGSDAIKAMRHSDWCPKYRKPDEK